MNAQEIGQVLKHTRKNQSLSVKEVVQKLSLYEIVIAEKTLYGWENGTHQPNADAFIALCCIYGITSLSIFSGVQPILKKSSELTEANSEDDTHKYPLLKIYNELNTDGQDRLMEYAEDLSDMPKYKKCHNLSDEEIG